MLCNSSFFSEVHFPLENGHVSVARGYEGRPGDAGEAQIKDNVVSCIKLQDTAGRGLLFFTYIVAFLP